MINACLAFVSQPLQIEDIVSFYTRAAREVIRIYLFCEFHNLHAETPFTFVASFLSFHCLTMCPDNLTDWPDVTDWPVQLTGTMQSAHKLDSRTFAAKNQSSENVMLRNQGNSVYGSLAISILHLEGHPFPVWVILTTSNLSLLHP